MKVSEKTVVIFFIFIILGMGLAINLFPFEEYGALISIIAMTITSATISFIFSLFTKDYSWTDRLWSTSPIAYAWFYTYASSFNNISILSAILVSIWGVRLTFNFARRDGYKGNEDYRWKILNKKISQPFCWTLFNLFFIAIYQQFLFICFTLPLYIVSIQTNSSFTIYSVICSFAVLAFITIETVADQQQFEFQQSKYGLLPKRKEFTEDYKKGFRTSGLFSISRHPNYLGELGVWWSIYFLGASTTNNLFNWTMIGPILLTLLFIGSTSFTENITKSKYPDYENYKKQVWPIFPKLIKE